MTRKHFGERPTGSESVTNKRLRWRHFGCALITIALGLASRHWAHHLPSWAAKNVGDVLYATMVFWLAKAAAPALPPKRAALWAVGVCFVIEFAKFLPWLDRVRHHPLGRLVLGTGFHASNLVCYGIGAALGCLLADGITSLGREKSV